MTKNVTVAIPSSVHYKARIWAAKRNTSLSAVVAYLLGNLDTVAKLLQQHQADNPPQQPANQDPQN